jgi:hypothetical protein
MATYPVEVPTSDRTVWVLARPIKAAQWLAFLSEGKFPLCHWAILVSDLNFVDFTVLWASKKRVCRRDSWRTLFELYRDENNINKSHMVEELGVNREFLDEWCTVFVAFMGTTHDTDLEIYHQGATFYGRADLRCSRSNH